MPGANLDELMAWLATEVAPSLTARQIGAMRKAIEADDYLGLAEIFRTAGVHMDIVDEENADDGVAVRLRRIIPRKKKKRRKL